MAGRSKTTTTRKIKKANVNTATTAVDLSEPLYKRYLHFEYPQSLEDEIAESERLFLQKTKGATTTTTTTTDMDAMMAMFDDVDAMLKEDAPTVARKAKEEDTAAMGAQVDSSTTAAGAPVPRYTFGRGFVGQVYSLVYGLFCQSNPDMMNNTERGKQTLARIQAVYGPAFKSAYERHMATLESQLAAHLQNNNSAMEAFFNALRRCKQLHMEPVGDTDPDRPNAWTGTTADAHIKVVVWNDDDDGDDDGHGVYVSREQSNVLAVCHQVFHWRHYMITAVLAHGPSSQTPLERDERLFDLNELWCNTFMGPKYANTFDINKWKVKSVNAFERDLLGLYTGLNVASEWMRRQRASS